MLSLIGHADVAYAAIWNPRDPSLLLSCSGDQTAKIWDVKQGACVQSITAHAGHVLSCDWDKYENSFATASADHSIAIWDIRNMSRPRAFLLGHSMAVRKVKYSPFSSSVLASASYDMTINVWNTEVPAYPAFKHSHHTEICIGVDFSMFQERLIASCGWDGLVSIWNYDATPPIIQ